MTFSLPGKRRHEDGDQDSLVAPTKRRLSKIARFKEK
jgi:hypothetical protein